MFAAHASCVASVPARRLPRCAAFTLVEMLMAVAIMAILTGVAVPALGRIVDATRLTWVANDFLASMYLARSEAIKSKGRAGLCKSADGASCAASGGWEQGWIVFRDRNSNGVLDAGEPVVQRTPALPSGFRLTGNQNLANYISFAPTGRTRMVSGAFQAGTLTLCKQATDSEARQIVINNAGRARVDRNPAHLCI